MKARVPANETERLRVLGEYAVLDTSPEQAFDDIVNLAAEVCDTPAAMITFVDEYRQWFKAFRGLAFRESSRDLSFCAHAILGTEMLVVPDASKDPRFSDNPLVTGPPHIRYYAGVPLISPAGLALGTLAVVDFTPRVLNSNQLAALQILSRQLLMQLELRTQAARHEARASVAETDRQIQADRHRALVDAALDAIVAIDAEGRLLEFNPASERLFGYARSEAIGRPLAELIIPPDCRGQELFGLAGDLSPDGTTMRNGRVEVTAMRRDGGRFPAELSLQRHGAGGDVVLSVFIRDITGPVQAAQALQASTERYFQQRQALAGLIQDERLHSGDLYSALRLITTTVAATLGVARVSVWRYLTDPPRIRCLDLYELAEERHSQGTELSAASVPAYFEAMEQQEVISASDARRDPRTSGFAADYLIPLGITSMLDARVHLHGALHGVLCLEHVGETRQWTQEDESFAVAAATIVSLGLEGEQRRIAQDALITQTQILTAVTEALAAYIERDDWKEAFSALLRCALTITESEYGFVGVVVEGADRPELRVLAHEGIFWDKVVDREFYDHALLEYQQTGYLTFHSFDNLFGRAITSGEVLIANDPAKDPRSSGRPAGHPPMHSFVGVPIHGRNEVTGIVALANRRGGYGREERIRIEALVRQAGGLCENYRQRERGRLQKEEREQVEAALRAADERLRLVSRATNDLVWDWNLETNDWFVPEGLGKLFGDHEPEPQHLTIETWSALLHPDDEPRVVRGLRAAIDDGVQVWSDEFRFRRPDGSYAVIFNRGYVLRNASGSAVRMIGAMMDVTGRTQLEAQFRQAQKLEAVGQLAGGVAHDFNNILTVIQGNASLMLEAARLGARERDSVLQIIDVSERGAGLTRQLLAFSRKQVLQTVDLDLNAAVVNMTRILQRILGEDITLQVEPSAGPAHVRADVTMMEQIIMNLAINARDAMTSGGTLSIRTCLEIIRADAVPPEVAADGDSFVRLSVTDTGCGIPDAVLPHIFEPFFTTKGLDRGTGLGLATVYGVVKQHRGWVTVQSSPQGSTFNVYLLSQSAPASPVAAQRTPASGKAANETILVVEDEAAVRQLARLLLERRGYTVLEAASGPAALAEWRRHPGRIDLVLTDMVMPDGLSGLTLAKQLCEESPALKVIVTSGYSVDLAGQDFSPDRAIRFLAKPYSARQLETAVRDCLDEP